MGCVWEIIFSSCNRILGLACRRHTPKAVTAMTPKTPESWKALFCVGILFPLHIILGLLFSLYIIKLIYKGIVVGAGMYVVVYVLVWCLAALRRESSLLLYAPYCGVAAAAIILLVVEFQEANYTTLAFLCLYAPFYFYPAQLRYPGWKGVEWLWKFIDCKTTCVSYFGGEFI
jgi:hypothetical protein